MERQFERADAQPAGGNLQFALSPYEEWQRLGWTGALIITVAVLTLMHPARALGLEEDRKMNAIAVGRRPLRHKYPEKMAIRDLSFYYGENKALKNIDLTDAPNARSRR